MFMNDSAGGREQTLPATLPRLVGQISVFHIEGMVKRIESANLQILVSIDRTRAAARPKNRDGVGRFIIGVDVVVPEIEESVFEPSPSLTCFFPPAVNIGKENLGRDREHGSIRKTTEQRR